MGEGRMARRIPAIVWVGIPPLLLSALIHSADPDVGGIQGLAAPLVLLSVAVYAIPLVAMALACLWLAIRFRWTAWVSASIVFAPAIGLIIAWMQTPRLPGVPELARPLLGGALLVWLILAMAVLPARALGWGQETARRGPKA